MNERLVRLRATNEDGSITIPAERYVYLSDIYDDHGHRAFVVAGPVPTDAEGHIDYDNIPAYGRPLPTMVVKSVHQGG